jgi:hypothetical protein
MTAKMLALLESQYLRAVTYAVLYQCSLSVEQFAASVALDPEELDALRAHLDGKGIGI